MAATGEPVELGPLRHPSFTDSNLRELLQDELSIAELHVDRGGRRFEVWVWGSRTTITMEQLNAVAPLVDDLVELDRRLLDALSAAFADQSEESVVSYAEHHADPDVMTTDTLNAVLGGLPHVPESIVARLRFLKVSIFADPDPQLGLPDNQVAVVDYGLGFDVTQYVLAVSVDINGNVLAINMES
jgi:hypothetical protein